MKLQRLRPRHGPWLVLTLGLGLLIFFWQLGATGLGVRRFVEKPTREKAEAYLATGRYYWNSGMFCFRAGVFLAELERSAPQVHAGVAACWQASA